jgi:hypothetical protein
MFLSLYDEVTNVLCVSLLSHDRYQYDSLILSKQTWTYPRQHLQQLLWCVISVRLNLPEVEEQKLCLWYTPTRRNHKELSLEFLEANMPVPCSHLLIGQSNGLVDFIQVMSNPIVPVPLCWRHERMPGKKFLSLLYATTQIVCSLR